MTDTPSASSWDSFKSSFDRRSFIIGFGVVIILYLFVCLYILLTGSAYLKKREGDMLSRTLLVEFIGEAPDVASSMEEMAGDNSDLPKDNTLKMPTPRVLPNPFEARGLQVMESGLTQAPIEAVSESVPEGVLPKVDEKENLTPFEAYRRPFAYPVDDTPYITIAIENMGLSDAATEAALRKFPPEITLIMSPYAANPAFWMNVARERGHEVWMHLPLETKDYPRDDPGPHAMIIDAPERDNLRKLRWLMTRALGYVGFVTSDDHVFIKSLHDMRPVIGEIYNRGLGFIDAAAKPSAIPATMAAGQNAPYGTVQLYLKEDMPLQEVSKALADIEKVATERGKATIIIYPNPASYQAVLKWLGTFDDKGLILAPLSAQTGY